MPRHSPCITDNKMIWRIVDVDGSLLHDGQGDGHGSAVTTDVTGLPHRQLTFIVEDGYMHYFKQFTVQQVCAKMV